MHNLPRLRLAKTWYAMSHFRCWPALRRRVAPSIEHKAILGNLEVDLLLDVGANRGQFSLMARMLFPRLPIHAYEPVSEEAAVYRVIHGSQQGVELHKVALGDQGGSAEMHISGSADSSSLLSIGELQTRCFPGTEEIGTRRVRVVTLDSLPDHWQKAKRALLKVDVQGFELNVLRGATAALRHCAFVYVECSEVALYAGQALRADVEDLLRTRGFIQRRRINPMHVGGRLVQADYLFCRS
jgi:FkbM family methyltransferase